MTAKKVLVSLGFDTFDSGITPLVGAANDARSWAALFEHRMGYTVKVLTQDELASGQQVLRTLREVLHTLGPGDLLGLFIASHGKTITTFNGRQEQVFLLPHASRLSLSGGYLGEGVVTLGQLESETAKPGLQRFFIIDACRSPLDVSEADHRDGDQQVVFEGEAVYRDLVLQTQGAPGSQASPLTIVNSCPNRHRALELRSQRRGWFSLSAMGPIVARLNAGQDVVLDQAWLNDVERAMQATAQQHQLSAPNQRPTREGGDVRLFSAQHAPAGPPAVSDQAHDEALLKRAQRLNTEAAWTQVALTARLEPTREAAEQALLRWHPQAQPEPLPPAPAPPAQPIASSPAAATAPIAPPPPVPPPPAPSAPAGPQPWPFVAPPPLAQTARGAMGLRWQQAARRLLRPAPLAAAAAAALVLGGLGLSLNDRRSSETAAPALAASAAAPAPAPAMSTEASPAKQAARVPVAPVYAEVETMSVAQRQALQSSTAQSLGLPVVFKDKLANGAEGPDMVVLPAAVYTMGSNAFDDEKPPHPRKVSAFALMKTEVTVSEYLACVNAGGCPEPEWRQAGSSQHHQTGRDSTYKLLGPSLTNPRSPVVGVSWQDAQAYAAWMRQQTKQAYRLATEAEWELATRAGSTTRWSFGDDESALGQHAWFSGTSDMQLHPVGSKSGNAWGLHDLHGSVWEWVADCWHDNYRGAPESGRAWDENCVREKGETRRVVRGGSWINHPDNLRSAVRDRGAPDIRIFSIGFRLARTF